MNENNGGGGTKKAFNAQNKIRSPKKMVKQSKAWPVYRIDWQLIIEEHVPMGSRGDLKAETESEILAAYEAFANRISCNKNTGNSNMANLCQQYDKTVDHIISTCPI